MLHTTARPLLSATGGAEALHTGSATDSWAPCCAATFHGCDVTGRQGLFSSTMIFARCVTVMGLCKERLSN